MNKIKPKILTQSQATELKFFCRNVVGVRADMYDILERTNSFDDRVKRLEKTCSLIEKFLGEELKQFPSIFDSATEKIELKKEVEDS